MNKRIMGVFSPKAAIGLAAFAGVGIGTIAVYRLLDRSGEMAIRMIPSDAAVVISLDTSPSPAQVQLYNEISRSMSDSGANDFIDKILEQADGGKGAFKSLRANVKGSFAAGAWGDLSKGNPDWVGAVALNDPGKAETLVAGAAGIRAENRGGRMYYSANGAPAVLTFYKDYALISNKPESALRAIDVAEGRSSSVYQEASFQRAREALPNDAGLMVFFNGSALSSLDKNAQSGFQAFGIDKSGWFALSVTLQDEGIYIDSSSPVGSGGLPAVLNKMSGVNFAGLEHFPEGAIGIAAVSSPSSLVRMIVKALEADPKAKEQMAKGIAEAEKKTGISFDAEFLPGISGELDCAMYPPADPKGEPTFVLTLDNQNAATATTLGTKLMEALMSGRIEGSPKFSKQSEGSWTIYRSADDKMSVAIGEDRVIVSSSPSMLRQTTKSDTPSIMNSDAFKNLNDNKNMKFVLQIDPERIAQLVEKGEGGPPIRQFLTGQPLTMTWTADNESCKSRLLIPVNIPAVIRFAGKSVSAQPIVPSGRPAVYTMPSGG